MDVAVPAVLVVLAALAVIGWIALQRRRFARAGLGREPGESSIAARQRMMADPTARDFLRRADRARLQVATGFFALLAAVFLVLATISVVAGGRHLAASAWVSVGVLVALAVVLPVSGWRRHARTYGGER